MDNILGHKTIIHKLKRKGLEPKFIKIFLNLLEYIKTVEYNMKKRRKRVVIKYNYVESKCLVKTY